MRPSLQTLRGILYSASQYVIPVFQRNYRWEAPQWEKLWDGLIEVQRPEKQGNHFMGFLVVLPGHPQPGENTTFYMIDGQQRVTTCSILLAAIRNVARRLGQAELAEEIHQYYLVHPLKKGEQHFRLLPKERDHDNFVAVVTGHQEPAGRIADALAHFEDRLTAHATDAPARLRQVFDTLCQRFEFMCATLEAENAYNIFKSLNSTGVVLGPSDLIRNFVFMHVPPEQQSEFDEKLWGPLESRFSGTNGVLDEERCSRFFRDYLMCDGRYVAPKDTFDSFEARYEATGFSPDSLARDLVDSALDYAVLSGRQPDGDGGVSRALAELNVFESPTTYPLLLTLFRRRRAGALDSAQIVRCLEMLRGFIVRRFICGETSRGYGQMFVRALNRVQGDPVVALESYLLERGWPDDRRFKSAFVEFPLYERGYKRELLEALERGRGHKEPADLSAAQVEHIMPQTLSDAWVRDLGSDADRIHSDWLHRPGNLTLSAYNQELWNHPFEKKRLRYADSNISITREVSLKERWGEERIRERGLALAEEAARLWTGPKDAAPTVRAAREAGDDGQGRHEIRTRFWQGLNDYLVAEHPELPTFAFLPNWTIRLPSGLRHVGIDIRFGLRTRNVGLDVWFWRSASLPAWERIQASPGEWNSLIEAAWEFERMEGQDRARMSVNQSAEVRDEATWSALYEWLGEKLSRLYGRVVPRLRDEIEGNRAS